MLMEIRLFKAYTTEKSEFSTGKKEIDSLYSFGIQKAKIEFVLMPLGLITEILYSFLPIGTIIKRIIGTEISRTKVMGTSRVNRITTVPRIVR